MDEEAVNRILERLKSGEAQKAMVNYNLLMLVVGILKLATVSIVSYVFAYYTVLHFFGINLTLKEWFFISMAGFTYGWSIKLVL